MLLKVCGLRSAQQAAAVAALGADAIGVIAVPQSPRWLAPEQRPALFEAVGAARAGCLGVLVVEAAERSGTLITARLALEAGREVFAIPGSPLDPRCRGANDLIRQGAHLVESAADVLAHLPEAPRDAPLFAMAPSPEIAPLTEITQEATPGEYGQLIDLIGMSPISVDDLLRRCHLSPPALQAALADLELEGRVDMLPGHRVALSGKG